MKTEVILYNPADFGAVEIKEDTRDAEIARLVRQIQDMDEMLLNQARTIKRLQEENEKLGAALKRDYGGVWDELEEQLREIELLRAENAHLKEKLENRMGRLAYYAMMNKREAAEETLKETGD